MKDQVNVVVVVEEVVNDLEEVEEAIHHPLVHLKETQEELLVQEEHHLVQEQVEVVLVAQDKMVQ